jgi:hypothetical protein
MSRAGSLKRKYLSYKQDIESLSLDIKALNKKCLRRKKYLSPDHTYLLMSWLASCIQSSDMLLHSCVLQKMKETKHTKKQHIRIICTGSYTQLHECIQVLSQSVYDNVVCVSTHIKWVSVNMYRFSGVICITYNNE